MSFHCSTSLRPSLLSLLIGVFMFTGCGGGGGGTPDLAPASITGRTIVIQDPTMPSVTITYVFAASTYTTPSPSSDSGSYTYAKIAGTTTKANLNINSSFSPALSYVLTFTSTTGGTYVDQSLASSTFTYLP